MYVEVMQAYILYVRPILEYVSTVWEPYTISNVHRLESVQPHVQGRF